jgi:hypothetical protein
MVPVKPQTFLRHPRSFAKNCWGDRRVTVPRKTRSRVLLWASPRSMVLTGKPPACRFRSIPLPQLMVLRLLSTFPAISYIRSVRRECLDHFIIFTQTQLRRVAGSYIGYYNNYRHHQGLRGMRPAGTAGNRRNDSPRPEGRVSSFCKVWILCVSIPQTNKATPGPKALKLLRVSGFLGMDPLANQEKAAGIWFT